MSNKPKVRPLTNRFNLLFDDLVMAAITKATVAAGSANKSDTCRRYIVEGLKRDGYLRR